MFSKKINATLIKLTHINLPTTVEKICEVDTLSVLNGTEFIDNVQVSSNIKTNNLSIGGNFVVRKQANFSNSIVTKGNVDMQNNRVLNLSFPRNLTDGISLDYLRKSNLESFLGVTDHFLYWWWGANTKYNWTSQLKTKVQTNNLNNYLSFDNTKITFNKPGIYKIGVTVGKSGYAGNGYGGFVQVTYTNNSNQETVMGTAGLLNSGVINSQGSIQTSIFVNKGEEGGYIELRNYNGNGFKMDYLVFCITIMPLF